MCGITGIFNKSNSLSINKSVIEKMVSQLDHRGPDDQGYYISDTMGLAQSRLSIIDIEGGKQPIHNEDKSIQVVFNGEIFNYIELRQDLLKKGHKFYTKSDTEVIVHAYEQYGLEFISHLNGQFAIAIWDSNKKELILARDRVGIRPLFYTFSDNQEFIFASEMKAIFAHPKISAEIDPAGINQIFTLWVNVPPQTVFKNIYELPPGHFMTVNKENTHVQAYWSMSFPNINDYDDKPISYYSEKLRELLYDSVTIRLRADVPVASYLSGGIDSSIISSLVKKYHNNDLLTFSVAFEDINYDERNFQMEMVNHIQTDHRIVEATYSSIGDVFRDVVYYAEKPMIRSAPAPLYILSRLVRENNIKVVLTGEGADEVFGGYNIFKEDKIRRFWARFPDSKIRPELLTTLYPYIKKDSGQGKNFWQLFFKKGLTDIHNPYYSHKLRWDNTSYIKKFLNKDYLKLFNENDHILHPLENYINKDILKWHPLSRAQYLEMSLFMSGYLLSSQGDRMMMGNSVEGRFPFLDHRVIEFANTVPPEYKINILNEKYILKHAYKDILPESIVERDKQPYRAPIYQCFIQNDESNTNDVLSKQTLNKFGYFNSNFVDKLISKANNANGQPIAARDDMAIVGITSLQLLHDMYVIN
jgi:asparagine synthase (glutamine-hydrolysing)